MKYFNYPLYEPAFVRSTLEGKMWRALIIFGPILFALSNAFGSGSGGGNAIEYVDLGSGMLQQLKEVITFCFKSFHSG